LNILKLMYAPPPSLPITPFSDPFSALPTGWFSLGFLPHNSFGHFYRSGSGKPSCLMLISSSTSPLVLFTSHLVLLGVYCVINICRNYCTSPYPLPCSTILSIPSPLAPCIGKGRIGFTVLPICQSLSRPQSQYHYHHHQLIALFPITHPPSRVFTPVLSTHCLSLLLSCSRAIALSLIPAQCNTTYPEQSHS
jgi:hypothetical protein